MGSRDKNTLVAAVALGCALFVMGVVGLGSGGQRGDSAAPEPGWKPEESEVLLRRPVEVDPPAAGRD